MASAYEERILEVMSGQARGVGATLTRTLLAAAEPA